MRLPNHVRCCEKERHQRQRSGEQPNCDKDPCRSCCRHTAHVAAQWFTEAPAAPSKMMTGMFPVPALWQGVYLSIGGEQLLLLRQGDGSWRWPESWSNNSSNDQEVNICSPRCISVCGTWVTAFGQEGGQTGQWNLGLSLSRDWCLFNSIGADKNEINFSFDWVFSSLPV